MCVVSVYYSEHTRPSERILYEYRWPAGSQREVRHVARGESCWVRGGTRRLELNIVDYAINRLSFMNNWSASSTRVLWRGLVRRRTQDDDMQPSKS